jgi:hypothetical protein
LCRYAARMKLQNTEDVVRSLAENLHQERQARAEAEARNEATVQRLEELGNQREQAVMRRFEHELEQRVSEISRRVVDESEGAVERDQAIVREKDEQLSAINRGGQKERQKNIEHMLVVEKAIREERAQRVGAVGIITKSIDKVNKDVTLLLRDEKAAREAREGKLRGQISQSVLKLHAGNKETQRKLEAERDGIHKVLKTEIRARMTSLEKLTTAVAAADKEHDRRLAAGRVEAAQALRSAEVKLSRRLTATEGRVEVEVAALRKLYARQTQLEKDLDAFKRNVREAFDLIQDDLTSAAVAQALNTECDAVNGDILQVTVKDLNDRIDLQDARDREKASMLEAAVSVLGEGQSGLQVRADKTEQDVGDIFNALVADERARAELEAAIARVAAATSEEAAERAEKDQDIKAALAEEAAVRAAFDAAEMERVADLETRADATDVHLINVDVALEHLQEEVDANAAANVLETETIKVEIDQAAQERGDNAEAAERIAERQTFVEEGLGELKGDLVEGIEAVRGELDAAAEDLRDAVAKESDARAEALGALEQRVGEASVKSKAEIDEAHGALRRAINAEVSARERAAAELHDRVDDETEARLADGAAFQEMLLEETRERDEAVVKLWAALEENYVAIQLEAECARIDAEEFSVAQVDHWKAAIGKETEARDAALFNLKAHVAAVVADEATARGRGDADVRHAYEDDIANLEDTAAEAVRELREGLRAEVTERKSEAETLHRDLGDALDAARSRLERDVRALEETAASNIAAQKLEEEMMRAELDDGMMRVDEALEALQANADANAATASASLAAAASEVKSLVAAGVAPVDAKLNQLAEAMEGGMDNLECSIEKEVTARHDYALAAQEVFDQMQDGISVGMQAMNGKVEEMLMAQVEATTEEFQELRSVVAESLESTNAAIEEAFNEVHKDMSKLETDIEDAAVSVMTAEEATRVELETIVEDKVRQEGHVRDSAIAELRENLRRDMEEDATGASANVDDLTAALGDLRQEVEQDREMQGEEMKAVNFKLDDLERDTAEAITGIEEKLRSDVAAETSSRTLVENELRAEIAKEASARAGASVVAAEDTAGVREELKGNMRDLQLAVREEFDGYTAHVMLDMEAQRTDLEEKMIEAERASNDAADEIRAAVTEAEAAAAAASDALREELMASLDAEAERTGAAIDSEAALREQLAAQLSEARSNIADSMEVERNNTLEALTRVEDNVAAEASGRAQAVEAEARERQDLAAELSANLDGVACDAKTDVETLRAELSNEIADAVSEAAAAATAQVDELRDGAADQLAAAADGLTAAAAEELAAKASAVREEVVMAERRLREEYTEALAGEAEMRERGDVAAAEGRAGLTGSIEEDRAVLSEALTKLEADLAAETKARVEAGDAAAATSDAAAADAATREETLRTEVFSAVDELGAESKALRTEVLSAVEELDARAAANLENESKARMEAMDAAATALEMVASSTAEAVVELGGEIDDKVNAAKEEVLQLIAGEAEERARAIKEAVDAEAAERREADEGLDQNLVQSLAHEMEERSTAVSDLGADIKAESETLRAELTAHAEEAAAAAGEAAAAAVAAEVTARSAAVDELQGVVRDSLGLAAEGRDQLKTAIEQEAAALREEIAVARQASDDAVAGEASARNDALEEIRGEMAEETAARTTADQEEAEARAEAVENATAEVTAKLNEEAAARKQLVDQVVATAEGNAARDDETAARVEETVARLAEEEAARGAAVDELKAAVEAEATARAAAVDEAKADVKTEELARGAALEEVKAGIEAMIEAEKAARVADGETFAGELVNANTQLGEFKSIVDAEISRLGGDLGEASGARENIAREIEALQDRVAADLAVETKAREEAIGVESKAREESIAAEAVAREEALAAFATEAAMKTELAALGEDLEGKMRDAAGANAGRDDEILQLITKEVADRDVAIKAAVDAEAAERAAADQAADQNLVESLAHEIEGRKTMEADAEAVKAELAALDERVAAEAVARDELVAKLRDDVAKDASEAESRGRDATEAAIAAAVGEEAVMRRGELEAEAAARTEALDEAAAALKSVVETNSSALASEAEARERAMEEADVATAKRIVDADAANASGRDELKATIAEGLKLAAETRSTLQDNLEAEATERREAVAQLSAELDAETRERREAVSGAKTEADEGIKAAVEAAVAELEGDLKPRIEAAEAAVEGVKEKVGNAATSAAEAKSEVDALRWGCARFQLPHTVARKRLGKLETLKVKNRFH